MNRPRTPHTPKRPRLLGLSQSPRDGRPDRGADGAVKGRQNTLCARPGLKLTRISPAEGKSTRGIFPVTSGAKTNMASMEKPAMHQPLAAATLEGEQIAVLDEA